MEGRSPVKKWDMGEGKGVAGGSHVHRSPKEAQHIHRRLGPRSKSLLVFLLPWGEGKDNSKVRPPRGAGMQAAYL